MNAKHRSPSARNFKSGVKANALPGATDKTGWATLKAMPDSAIKFTKDSPRTSPDDWVDAIVHRGLPLPAKSA